VRRAVIKTIGQATAFDELEIRLGHLLHARTRLGVGAVVKLARVLERVPVLHHDPGAARVEQLVLRIPGRTVVEVGIGLHIHRAFDVARGRLVGAQSLGDVGVGLPQRRDADGTQVDLHGTCLLGLVV